MNDEKLVELLYYLKIVDQQVTDLFEEHLGISITRYHLLKTLLYLAPCKQQDLQENLQIDQAAITRHLKILETAGYVIRERNPENQREVLVKPSSKAIRELIEAPSSQHLSIKQQMEEVLLPEERVQLQQLLTKLNERLHQLHL